MSKLSKILSGILVLSMVFSLVTTKANAFTVADDVAGTVYEDSASVLGALGIMIGDDTGLFRPDDAVTRAEFSKIAVHILGLKDTADSSKGISKFPDVPTSHWANGYINVATSQNIIVGDDTGTFRPDDKISYQEAVTILVRALGYEHVALSKGGYPTGYLVVGSDTGITKKATSAGITPCPRGLTAILTFNSLTVNLMEPVGFTEGHINYQVTDKTLLENKLGVTKSTGRVTGNFLTKLTGTSALNKDQVEIDSKEIFKAGNSNIEKLLGFNVTYYVKEEENGDKTVILAQTDSSKNGVVTIPVEHLAQELKSDSTSILYYEDKDDSKAKELVLETEKNVIYNDKFASSLTNPKTGTVTLLDINSNGKYDVVFINEYVNYIVDEVSLAGKKIYDKFGAPALDLDTEKNKDLAVILENTKGQKIELSDIKEWNTVSVFKNTDYIKAVVSDEFVSGKIEEISPESETVVINKTEFSVASNLDFKTLTLDLEGTFYLDMNGDIAGFNAEYKKGSKYAYLINAGLDGSMDSVLNLKLFTSDGETVTVKAADKIKIDDKTGFDAINAYNEISENGKGVKPAIISYELNQAGEITLIDRAEDKTSAFPESFDKTLFALNFKDSDMVFKKATNKLVKIVDSKVTKSIGIDENTIIFAIGVDEKDSNKMEMITLSQLNDESKYNVEVFDMTDDLTAKVIRVTNTVSVGKTNSPIAIVDKITTTNNSDNSKVDKVYMYTEGKRIEINTEDENTLKFGESKVSAGDIIQYTVNAKGELDSFALLFDASDKGTEFVKQYGDSDEMSVIYGKVTKKFTNSINVSVNGGGDINYLTKDATVYKIDTNKTNNKISVTDSGEISKWETDANEARVFLRIYEDVVKEIVIVE